MLRRATRLPLLASFRRGLATEAATGAAAAEDDGRFMKFVGGIVGLCVLQRMIPKATPHVPEAPKKRKEVPAPAPPAVVEPVPAASPVSQPSAQPSSIAAAVAAPPAVVPPPAVPKKPNTAAAKPPKDLAEMTVILPTGAKDLGMTQGWRVFQADGSLFALSMKSAAPLLQLTPSGVEIGAVLIGDGELLVEYPSGSLVGLDASTLYRVKLPDPSEPTEVEPSPDTLSPAGVATAPGEVVSWITVGSPLAVRGALVRSGSALSLALRTQDVARLGNPRWLQTCKRLGLPAPPPDPTAQSPIFSDWRCVATFKDEAVSLIGFKDETAWVHNHKTAEILGISPDGSQTALKL